jgi:serine/threonine protein kinase
MKDMDVKDKDKKKKKVKDKDENEDQDRKKNKKKKKHRDKKKVKDATPPPKAKDIKVSVSVKHVEEIIEVEPLCIGPDKRYILLDSIGSGSFGHIFAAQDRNHKKVPLAVKLEKVNLENPHHVLLHTEFAIYYKILPQFAAKCRTIPELKQRFLRKNVVQEHSVNHGLKGVCQTYWFGKADDLYYAMVIDRVGTNLENLFNQCNRKFTLATVLKVGIQILDRIEMLHECDFIHRDLKPENFAIGLKKSEQSLIYILDFGLVKRYRDGETKRHIGYSENKQLVGTLRYASLSSHLGIQQSRKDDLEELGYILVYFQKGSLPWQTNQKVVPPPLPLQLPTDPKQKYRDVIQDKLYIPLETICQDLDPAFTKFLRYARALDFDEDPDYKRLRKLLLGCAKRNNLDLQNSSMCWIDKK